MMMNINSLYQLFVRSVDVYINSSTQNAYALTAENSLMCVNPASYKKVIGKLLTENRELLNLTNHPDNVQKAAKDILNLFRILDLIAPDNSDKSRFTRVSNVNGKSRRVIALSMSKHALAKKLEEQK